MAIKERRTINLIWVVEWVIGEMVVIAPSNLRRHPLQGVLKPRSTSPSKEGQVIGTGSLWLKHEVDTSDFRDGKILGLALITCILLQWDIDMVWTFISQSKAGKIF